MSLGVGERLGMIGRRAPRWRGWNRYRVPGGEGNVGDNRKKSVTVEYRVPGGGGKVGDNRKESVTVEGLEQVQSPWGWGKGWGQ